MLIYIASRSVTSSGNKSKPHLIIYKGELTKSIIFNYIDKEIYHAMSTSNKKMNKININVFDLFRACDSQSKSNLQTKSSKNNISIEHEVKSNQNRCILK